FENKLAHLRGVISMARSGHPDSAGSQFFLMTDDAPHLDGQYAAFGQVTGSMDELDRIVGVRRDARDKPLTPQTMVSVTVDTFGEEYPAPETV
ncbi:MAG: peptidylprolyl isomerase, partial [Oscillospiraceae bacterium]